MLSPRALVFLSLASLIALTSCGSPNVWVKSTESLELASAQELDSEPLQAISCVTHNGAIDLRSDSATEQVDVEVEKKVGGYNQADAELAMNALRIIREQRGDTLYLGWKWSQSPNAHWGASVNFTIKSPINLRVTAESHNGPITIVGTGAEVRAMTHNGRIRIEDVVGTAYAHSHNGRIEVAGAAEEIDVHTHNGGVKVASDATTVRGSITTHNGGVQVDLNEATSTKLRCETYNGSISTDLTLSSIAVGRHSLVGTAGKGGGDLLVETHNGSIRVR